jgi:hypothetical protein
VTILAEKFIAPGFACAVRWYLEHMFAFAPAGAYVGQWLQSFREFPPPEARQFQPRSRDGSGDQAAGQQ